MYIAILDWPASAGGGSVTVRYDGRGDGTLEVSSSDNPLVTGRMMTLNVTSTDGTVSATLDVRQDGRVAYYLIVTPTNITIREEGKAEFDISTDGGAWNIT